MGFNGILYFNVIAKMLINIENSIRIKFDRHVLHATLSDGSIHSL